MNKIKHVPSYFILEFADGVQLVPHNWMTKENKAAYWPNFTNNKRYDKAVKGKEVPQDSWKIFPVMKILGTAQTYERGIERLKEAEAFSEVNNSDLDEVQLKQTRRKRARIAPVSSDEESDVGDAQYKLAPLPTPPNFEPRQPETNVSKKPKHADKTDCDDNDTLTNLVSTPRTSFSKRQVNTTHSHKQYDERELVAGNEDFQFELSDLSCDSRSLVSKLQSTPAQSCKKFPPAITDTPIRSQHLAIDASSTTPTLVNTDVRTYQRFVIRSLTALKMKINSISEAVEDIAAKQKSKVNETFNLDCTESSVRTADIMKRFPLRDLTAVEETESDLTDENYKRQLMNTLAKIGGADIKMRAKKLMERVFTNCVAEKFSWIGGKKKLVFSNLLICAVIVDVVRLPTPQATTEEISTPIKNWLRHAKERLDREKMRVEKVVERETVDENSNDAITEEVADQN